MWGRILAGEVQREGSFSFNTLRIVSELDARTAAIFQREVKLKFLDSLLNDDDAKADVTDAIVLESIGLIHGVGSNLSKKLPLKVPGFLNFKMGVWALKVNLNDITAKTADFEVYPLTPAGLQLAAILQQDQEGTLRRVAKVLAGQSSKIVLFKLQNEQIVTPGEVLKETSHAQQAG
ncbi:MAG: DUF2806 domain-containing protein [Mesorhizobium sp.]|nr:MAG: DUF2806 domain-containing protein [Mesorhizobium sp.]